MQFRNWILRFQQPVAPGAALQIAVSRRFDYTSRTRRRHHELGSFWLRLPAAPAAA
jgi:hypothetical protein